jgi:multidrug efflux pump subunit AcrA (membrane-fusion protein)
LERCRIKAPFNAWVTEKAVETGQHLAIGQPVGSIYRAGAFDIEVKIPMADLAWFPDGVGSGEGPPAEVLFTETSAPKLWNGRVARVKAALDRTTRTLPVVIEVDEPAAEEGITRAADRLKPGMFITVRIQGRQVENVHRLPRHLIHDGDTVYLAAADRLSIQPVTILRRFKKSVLISDGLSDGDLVVTTPLSGAVPGMKIRLKPEDGGRMMEDMNPSAEDGSQKPEG